MEEKQFERQKKQDGPRSQKQRKPWLWGLPFSLAFLEERIFVDREIESKHKENELQSMDVLRSLSLFLMQLFFFFYFQHIVDLECHISFRYTAK